VVNNSKTFEVNMKFFTIVTLLACWCLFGNQASAQNSTPGEVKVTTDFVTYTIIDVGEGLFAEFDVVLVSDSCDEIFVIFSSRHIDTSTTSLAERGAVTLTSGQQYALNLSECTFDSVPEPNIHAPWDNLSICIDLGDTTLLLWQSGSLTQKVYVCPNIWSHYYVPPRKD
jgi:hypothetical protein